MMKRSISRFPYRTKNSPAGLGEFIFLKEAELFFPELPFNDVVAVVGILLL